MNITKIEPLKINAYDGKTRELQEKMNEVIGKLNATIGLLENPKLEAKDLPENKIHEIKALDSKASDCKLDQIAQQFNDIAKDLTLKEETMSTKQPTKREILFRGKSLYDDKWVYGSLLHFPDGYCSICMFAENNTLNQYRVDPTTIGQYTGIKDKNGTKIFEGDIVRDALWHEFSNSPDILATIEFRAGCFGIVHEGRFAPEVYSVDFVPEVVGNIYDNPERIKEALKA